MADVRAFVGPFGQSLDDYAVASGRLADVVEPPALGDQFGQRSREAVPVLLPVLGGRLRVGRRGGRPHHVRRNRAARIRIQSTQTPEALALGLVDSRCTSAELIPLALRQIRALSDREFAPVNRARCAHHDGGGRTSWPL
ncbi:hypothetical protein E1161_20370 [Saccharopolyspora aridisoli]|uniref:Uncharacterized protein n=1 Tax=Saccharopolyspora aridisoli TaxID=2530385 RepID=A0A4R4UIE6_9PSEU|nr:hypothetical protein [Saccharopolyspora aridisoli]TDC89876.1 hypothetical protein E1161_20370 [Saccharopolyspora aridisoli]